MHRHSHHPSIHCARPNDSIASHDSQAPCCSCRQRPNEMRQHADTGLPSLHSKIAHLPISVLEGSGTRMPWQSPTPLPLSEVQIKLAKPARRERADNNTNRTPGTLLRSFAMEGAPRKKHHRRSRWVSPGNPASSHASFRESSGERPTRSKSSIAELTLLTRRPWLILPLSSSVHLDFGLQWLTFTSINLGARTFHQIDITPQTDRPPPKKRATGLAQRQRRAPLVLPQELGRARRGTKPTTPPK